MRTLTVDAANRLASLPTAVVNGQEGFVSVLLHVYIRFGKWEEIAAYPMPEDAELYAVSGHLFLWPALRALLGAHSSALWTPNMRHSCISKRRSRSGQRMRRWGQGTVATLHYARAIMHGVQGAMPEARAEQAAFEQARAVDAMAERYIHNNKVTAILEVGAAMLRGELAYRDGDYEAAWAGLREVHLRPRAL